MIKINEYTKIAISSLSKKLDDNHPRIRAKAAESLGEIGLEEAIPGLLKALEDSNEFVRFSAADAIGKIGSRYALT
jgi:HEAT repeat protein